LAEAAATLKLLVELYREAERKLEATESPPASSAAGATPSLREQALVARVAELERRLSMLAEGFLEIDLLETA
jgi:hypothetical protein